MNTSRRGFLYSLTGGIAASMAALPARMTALSSTAPFEPFRSSSDQGVIRLHSNENAYGPSPRVLDALRASLSAANRYPRLEYPSLVERIAALHSVKPEQVLLGCGSTEMLRTAALAFLGNGEQLLQASPTFEAIGHYATAAAAHVLSVPLALSFAHDLETMLARVSPYTPLVYICNPNNPTASLTPRKDLELFISKLPASMRVVIDEAYHHYAGKSGMYASFIDHPLGDERVVVTRTFSKVYGLAGMRLGYAVAAPEIIKQMRKFATADNINAAVTQAAMAALDDAQSVQHFVELNSNDRQEFFNQAMARALKPIDSHANFVMMNSFYPADEVAEHFRKNNILIGRPFPPMNTYIRVSLGRPEEMQAFWQVWDKLPYAKNTMSH